jgi:hypothetical protein
MLELPGTRAALTGWVRLFIVLAGTVLAISFLSTRPFTQEAVETMPWIACAFVCYLAPIFISPSTDLFAPPGIVGINGGLATAAMLAVIAQDGGAMFRSLGIVPVEHRIELARGAALLMIVAQLSYLFGYYRSSGEYMSRLFPRVAERRWRGGRVLVVVLLTGLLVVPVYVLFQREMGGSVLDVTNLARGKAILRDDVSRTWMTRGIYFAFVPTLLLACVAIIDRSRRLLLVTAVVFAIVALLVTRLGPRRPAFEVGFMILLLFHWLWRKVRVGLVVTLLLISVSVVNTLGEYRNTGGEDKVGLEERLTNPSDSMAEHEKDRSRLDVLGTILHFFPERQDYLLGQSYLAISTFWVPQWIWPDKSTYFEWQSNHVIRRLVGLPAPMPSYGEMYANFSWFGVVLGMALFGAFHRGLARYREKAPRDAGVVLIYTTLVVSFSPTLLGFSALLQYAIPLTLLIYVVSQRRGQELPLTPALASTSS